MYGITIEQDKNISLTRQICTRIRSLIETGELKSGMKLPSTRKMAGELNVNRNTVVEVYEQLTAEGYLESKTGSGTFVAAGIDRLVERTGRDKEFVPSEIKSRRNNIISFEAGIPDLSMLPLETWGKLLRQASENSYYIADNLSNILGDIQLREVLADYVFRVKGIRCHPEQIMIVSGSSEGFLLIAQAMSDSCRDIYIEDPTVDFTRSIFNQMNYQLHPVPVDQNGMNLPEYETTAGRSLFLLTPSHQFPTGSILSIQRRLRIIEKAVRTDSYIIEDDYDSEFRYKGIPIPPLQVLSPSRVIYTATFSKTLFPGLRLGFIIIPGQLLEKMTEVKSKLNMFTPIIEQRALAGFIKEGHLDHHIYRMKKIYKSRRDLLVNCLAEYFGDRVSIIGDDAGMHIQVEFQTDCGKPDWNKAADYGVKVEAVEEYSMIKGSNSSRVVLAYGNINNSDIEEGVKRLYNFIHKEIDP